MFRFLRIAILLTVLVVVAGNQLLTDKRHSDWKKPLWVTIYPVLASSDAGTRRYVDSLTAASFDSIGLFFEQQARNYEHHLQTALVFQLAQPLNDLPPAIPPQGSRWKAAIWSLKMRLWAWRNGSQDDLAPSDIRMFVIYQTGDTSSSLERSVGVKNASYGVVNALASRNWSARNRIVITHELLHILGASDKYDFATGQPKAPDGLANPAQSPMYPQNRAEIMGGRIATSATTWNRPSSLKSCVIGAKTATEIGWSWP